MSRFILAIVGCILVVVGIIGVFVPLLPTTPFLLLAAACFARSSPSLHHWLLTNAYFGKYLGAYCKGEGIPRHLKISTLILLWLSLGLSAFFALPAGKWWPKAVLFLVGVAITYHILRCNKRSTHSL